MFKARRSILAMVLALLLTLGSMSVAVADGPVQYDTPQTFTLWCAMDKAAGAISDWSENLVYKTMAELTNVTVEFLHPPVGGEGDAFNLLCASGDYPDAIQYGWLSVPGGPANYINDEVIIPLNDLMDQHAPNMMAWLNANSDIKRECIMDDGTFYVLPAIYADVELATHTGPVIREDMLPLVGMTVDDLPTTIQGWEDMLVKVKETPELEGVIPFFFSTMSNITDSPTILGAFGITQEFYNDNGTVKFGVIQPEYKEFLKLMNKWFEMDLLDPEFAANTAKLRDEKVTNNQVFTFIGSMGNSITRYTAMCRPNNPDFKLIPMRYPTLNEGETPVVGQQTAKFTGGGVAITTACENPELIVKFYDYFYTDEGHILSNWGIEGETYALDAEGNPYFLPIISENPDGLSREQAMAKYTIWQSISPVYKLKDVLEQRDLLPEQIEGRKNWMACTNDILMPPVTPTAEEASEFANIFNDVRTYYWEQATKIIMGNVDLDEGFDVMVATLKGMGIDRAIELRQAALDRYLQRP
ncbi:MAG TPA: extracellular solute-binding protein [Clostridia bacterium]|nr:extracellular solute-binding protein [Clostridia bacterium]